MVSLTGARFGAVIFDLFGTLVPEFPREAFFANVRAMGEMLGAEPAAFEAGWSATAMARQTGGFATIEEAIVQIESGARELLGTCVDLQDVFGAMGMEVSK